MTILAGLFVALGLSIGGAGIWLIALGGSSYYLLAGILFLIAGGGLWRRSALALVAYSVLTAGSLVWAVSEVGLDWWALAPRGGLIVVLGIVLLAGLIFRRPPSNARRWRAGGAALGASLVAAIAVAVGAMMNDPHRIAGAVPEATAATLTPSPRNGRSSSNPRSRQGLWPTTGGNAGSMRTRNAGRWI